MSSIIMAPEQHFLKASQEFERMLNGLREASRQGQPVDEVERRMWADGREILRVALEGFVRGAGTGDLGETIEYEGRTLRRLAEQHDRRYVSVFGELSIPRTVYGTRETQKHEIAPVDAILNLPESDFSYLLQDWAGGFCVKESYAEARDTIDRILGIRISVRSLEQMTSAAAARVDAFRESKPCPDAQEEDAILVLTADGKGVPMRGADAPKSPKVSGASGGKREACVGAVYTIAPFVRTPSDVVDEMTRKERNKDRPRPRHKDVRAELTRSIDGTEENGKDRVFAWFAQQVTLRNGDGMKPIVCLMDGARALWDRQTHFIQRVFSDQDVEIIRVLDIYHVMERLWTAAHCFHAVESVEAKEFVTARLLRILEGDVGRVIGGLRQMLTKHDLRGSKRQTLQQVIAYLANNRWYMRYDHCLAEGYPIGSGVAEGACRHLIKDRMERTGMRWRIGGAQSILDLRAIYINGEWDAFQNARVKMEQERLYPHRSHVQTPRRAA